MAHLNHIGVYVRDIEEAKHFFEKYFGIGGSSTFTEPDHKTVTYDLNSQEPLSMVAEPKISYRKQSD